MVLKKNIIHFKGTWKYDRNSKLGIGASSNSQFLWCDFSQPMEHSKVEGTENPRYVGGANCRQKFNVFVHLRRSNKEKRKLRRKLPQKIILRVPNAGGTR